MPLIKYFWAVRMLMLSIIYRDVNMPGYLGKPIFLSGLRRLKIGKNVRIYPHLRLEILVGGSVEIKGNVSIGQGLHITSQGKLTINSGTVITGNVAITNIDHQYEDISRPVLEQPHLVSDTEIGENCFIGFGCVIQAGTILGKHCIVGANSVVRGHFPDYSVIVGAPARIVKRFDIESEKWVRS